jgi:glyoxylase-like metal-dependent hydrolase (beta-lactamase superfamily II)
MPERVDTFAAGPLSCNCSIVADPVAGEAAVIDPGGEVDRILEVLKAHGLELKAIIHTHAHIDHILGTKRLAQETGAPIWLHEADLLLYQGIGMQAAMLGMAGAPQPPDPDHFCVDGEELLLGDQEKLTVLHTPGHTPGSVCFHAASQGTLYSGDTLFRGGIGRTDLWGGSYPQIITSIRERLLSLPGDTEVFPGHGPATTIASELQSNPFLQS